MYPKNCAECPHYNGCDSYYGSPNCMYKTVKKKSIVQKILEKLNGDIDE